jgi:F-type H+-transporting ATPase subunit c
LTKEAVQVLDSLLLPIAQVTDDGLKSIALGVGAGLGSIGAGIGLGLLFSSIQWLGFALIEAVAFYTFIFGLIAFFL